MRDWKTNDVVWVKCGSYPWWPASISEAEDEYQGQRVEFFNDDTDLEVASCKKIEPFHKDFPKMILLLKNLSAKHRKAVREVR